MLKIPVDSSMMVLLFGNSGKSFRSTIQQKDVYMKQDGLDAVTLKGSIEKVSMVNPIYINFVWLEKLTQAKY